MKIDLSKAEHAMRMATLTSFLRDALVEAEPGSELETHSMFGGMGYYVQDRMFAGYYGKGLAFKLADADRKVLLKVEGAQAGMGKDYVEVPLSMLADSSLLVPWIKKSLAYVRSLSEEAD